MNAKQRGRAGGFPPARPEPQTAPVNDEAAPRTLSEKSVGEDTKRMSPYGLQAQGQLPQTHKEGVTVIGEAVRRVPPENAEFLIEITASAPTAAQALHDNQSKTTQVSQAVGALGVHAADIQTISLNVFSLYAPMMQGLPGSAGMPQIGPAGFSPYTTGPVQPEVQFGSYHARNTLRVNVRQPARVGEIVDAATRAGATVASVFSFQVADEASARRALLEAAGKDARSKAETLAAAAGKQVGDPISITEDCIVSNGAYAALRSAAPFAFGAGASQVVGELEYYARVSASFRLQ
jgi:uncharacterized protein YggE